MHVSFEAAKACVLIISFTIVFLISTHFFRRKIDDMGIAMIPSTLIAFISTLPFYGLSITRYMEESQALFLGLDLIENSHEFALGAGLAVVGFSSAFLLSTRLEQQEYRSLFHVVPGLLFIYFILINADVCLLFLGLCIMLMLIGEYLRLSGDESPISQIAKRMLDSALMGSEVAGYLATLFFLIGVLIVILFLPAEYAIGSIIILSIGDPSAVLVGKRFGKHKWNHNPKKSLEGSGAMFAVGTLGLVLFSFEPWVAIVVSLSATLFESLPLKVSDNLIIPLISGMVLVSLLG